MIQSPCITVPDRIADHHFTVANPCADSIADPVTDCAANPAVRDAEPRGATYGGIVRDNARVRHSAWLRHSSERHNDRRSCVRRRTFAGRVLPA